MPHEIDSVPDTPWFHLGVIAPPQFEPSGRQLSARLRGLVARRRERIGLRTVFGQPIAKLAHQIAKEMRWRDASHGPPRGTHFREWVMIAASVDALAVVHAGGPLSDDLRELMRVCGWLRTQVRVLVIGPDVSPL